MVWEAMADQELCIIHSLGEVQLQVELGCSTLPLWWSPRARAPVSGYALEGHMVAAVCRMQWTDWVALLMLAMGAL